MDLAVGRGGAALGGALLSACRSATSNPLNSPNNTSEKGVWPVQWEGIPQGHFDHPFACRSGGLAAGRLRWPEWALVGPGGHPRGAGFPELSAPALHSPMAPLIFPVRHEAGCTELVRFQPPKG